MAKIMLAEDEALIRKLIRRDLADDGHVIIEAINGDIASELLGSQAELDLLLTDIRMPGTIDGWMLGQLAVEAFPGIRVIYATGYSKESRALEPHERLLNKPFLFSQVRQAIADLGVLS
jgi:CheY-like chemotaxis protein